MRPVASAIPVSLGYRQPMKSRPGYIHRGIDFAAPVDTPIHASTGGTVVHVGRGGMGVSFGIHVVIKTGSVFHIYAHQSRTVAHEGQAVKIGALLGHSGASGNVTGPHLHYGEFTSYSYLKDRKPQFLDDAAPKPKALPAAWFRLGEWNWSGFDDVHGKASWNAREPHLVSALKNLDLRIACLIEIPDGKVASVRARLKKIGKKIVVGTDGRYIVCDEALKVGRTAVVTLTERGPSKDDKQVVFAEITPDPKYGPVLIECGHLEFREGAAYDAARVAQAKQIVRLGDKYGEAWGIPEDRRFYCNDENSDNQVSAQAFGTRYPDVMDTAVNSINKTSKTLVGWSGATPKGKPIDKIHAHKHRKIRAARVRTDMVGLADHLPTVVVVAKN